MKSLNIFTRITVSQAVSRRFWASMLIVGASLTLTGPSYAQTAIGQIKNVSGEAQILRDAQVLSAAVGLAIRQEDVVRTGADSALGMTFIDNSTFSIGPNSEIALERFRFDTTTHEGIMEANVKKGTLAVISGKIVEKSPQAMTLRTPSSILGVRGTKFLVEVGE
ncbi:MAG: FecR family protein [Alphaproteobacteria bacterium]